MCFLATKFAKKGGSSQSFLWIFLWFLLLTFVTRDDLKIFLIFLLLNCFKSLNHFNNKMYTFSVPKCKSNYLH